jgi:hypothetical protein
LGSRFLSPAKIPGGSDTEDYGQIPGAVESLRGSLS